MSDTATARAWQDKERAEGRCPRCRRPQTEINPKTGRPFWRCKFCRDEHMQYAKSAYHAKKAMCAA